MSEVKHFNIDGTIIDIPVGTTVNNGELKIQINGVTVATFTANQSGNVTASIAVPTKVSELTNDSGYITDAGVTGVKGNSETNYRTGNVNITKSNIGLGNVPNVTTNNQTPTFTQASSRANIASGETLATIFGKIMKWFADLKTVAFSGSYADLSNQPTIPTVNNGTLTIQKNGTNVQTFSANQSSNATANITVPTKVSELTNDSGYTTNTGTVTQVKVGSTAYNPSSGVVSLPAYPSVPTVNNGTLTIQKNGTNVQTFTANSSTNKTANITVPTKTSELTNDKNFITSGVSYLANAVTVACSNQVWKRLGALTIPANKKCVIVACVRHALANVGCIVSIGTSDANDNTISTSIQAGTQTFDFHRTTLTGIITTGSSATTLYCNAWLTGGSGNVTLSSFAAYYFD